MIEITGGLDTVMEHRGYDGSIEFDTEDGCYHGRILNIDDALFTYEGDDLPELEASFHEVVDIYIKIKEEEREVKMKNESSTINSATCRSPTT